MGEQELALIAASDYAAFPPRLERQPIFSPVLNEEYARQIARKLRATGMRVTAIMAASRASRYRRRF